MFLTAETSSRHYNMMHTNNNFLHQNHTLKFTVQALKEIKVVFFLLAPFLYTNTIHNAFQSMHFKTSTATLLIHKLSLNVKVECTALNKTVASVTSWLLLWLHWNFFPEEHSGLSFKNTGVSISLS